MSLRGSPVVFAALYCVAYVLVFVFDLPLVRYYPVPQEWAWGPADAVVRPGPAMAWYGLMASAALVAAPGAFLVRERWVLALCANRLWLWPCAAVVACIVLLRPFFLA